MAIVKHNGRYIRHKAGPIGPKQTTTATLPTYSFGDIISQRVVTENTTYFRHLVLFTIDVIGENATKIILQFSAGVNAEIPFGEAEVPNVVGDYSVEIAPPFLRQSYPIQVRVRSQGAGAPSRADRTITLQEVGGMEPDVLPSIYCVGDQDETSFMGTTTLRVQHAEYPVNVDAFEYLWEVYDENGDILDTFTTETIEAPNPGDGDVYTVRCRETAYDEEGTFLNSIYTENHNIVPFVDFPEDIDSSAWTVSTITDPTEASNIVGRQKLVVVSPITIPDEFKLYWYTGTSSATDDSVFNNELPLLNETDTTYATTTGSTVGTVIYPKLYWERIADNAVQVASIRPSFPIQNLNTTQPPDTLVPPAYLRVSSGNATNPTVTHAVGNLLVACCYTSNTGAATITAPNGTWTQIGSTLLGATTSSAMFYKIAASTTEFNGLTWPFITRVWVFNNIDPADPIGAVDNLFSTGTSSTSDPGLTLENTNSLVLSMKIARGTNDPGARSGITVVNSSNHTVSGYSTTIPAVSPWAAESGIANPAGNVSGYHSWAVEIRGVPPAVDPGGSWPADISTSNWDSYSVTNATEATGGVAGMRAATIAPAVTIPDGYQLLNYFSTSNTPTPSLSLGKFTSSVRYLQSTNSVAVGTTIYPKLYWYRNSDQAYKLASSRPSYTTLALTSVPTEDIVVVNAVAADIVAAVTSAPANRVIEVRNGSVGNLNISGISKSGVVTIRPNNRANPPVFSLLNASNTNNIKLDGLTISVPQPSGLESGTRLTLSNANNWEVVDCLIEGGLTTVNLGNTSNGKFWYNSIRRSGRDSLAAFGSIRTVEISHNKFYDFRIDLVAQNQSDMHPDTIQFNCLKNDAYSADVTIDDNIIDSRQIGSNNHGVFARSETQTNDGRPLEGTNACGKFRFKIRRNFIRGNHRDGIHCSAFVDSEVSGNKCIRVTQTNASNPGGTITTTEARTPMVYITNEAGTVPPAIYNKNLIVDNNVVSDASNGSNDANPWNSAREGVWGTNVVVTRHVVSNSEDVFPVGWVMPTAGQYSRGNGP